MSLAKSLPVEDRLLRYQTILINGKNETATTTSKLQKELIDIRKDYRELLESAEARRIVRTATDSGHSNLMWDHVVCAFVSHANRWLITDFSESRGASAESERKASLESLDFVLALAHEDGPVLNNGANKLLKLIYEGLKRDDRRLRYGIAFLRLFGRHYTSYPVYVARLSGYANKGTVHFLNKSSELSALGFYTSEFMSLLLDCALNCDHPRWAEETAIKMGGAGIGGIGSGTPQTLRTDALKISPSQKDFLSAFVDWIDACPTHASNVEQSATEIINAGEIETKSRSVAAGSQTLIPLSGVFNNITNWLKSGRRLLNATLISEAIVNEWCDTYINRQAPIFKSYIENVVGVSPIGSGRANDKVDPLVLLPPSQAIQDVFVECLRMVSAVLLHRGRTAHCALAHTGGPLFTYFIGKVWDSLYVSQRGQHVFRKECSRTLLLAIRVTVSAYSAHRGDDSLLTTGELICSGYAAKRRNAPSFLSKSYESRSLLPSSSSTPSPSLIVANSSNDSLAGYLTDMGCGTRIEVTDDGSFYDLLASGQGNFILRGTSSALPVHLSPLNAPPPTCIAAALLGTHYTSHAVYISSKNSNSFITKPEENTATFIDLELLESWGVSSPSSAPPTLSSSSLPISENLPRILLSPLSSPRMHNNVSDGDVIFPLLLRLVQTLLIPSEILKGSAQMAGSAPTESYSHIGDPENVPEAYQHSNLAAEALYHAHSVATATSTSRRFRKNENDSNMHVISDTFDAYSGYPQEFHPGNEKSNVFIWPRLIQSICSVKSSTGSGFLGSTSTASSSAAAASVPNLDLLSSTLMSHPDLLPRGLPTAALIGSLSGELSSVLQRQEGSLAATLKALFVLVEIAIGDDTLPSFTTLVSAGKEKAGTIRAFCVLKEEQDQIDKEFIPGSSLAILTSRSASLLSKSQESISSLNPTLPFAIDVYRRIGDLADASAVQSHLANALKFAIEIEAQAWSSCVFSLIRTFLPQIASRKEGRLLQQGIRLLSRILAMGRSRSGARSSVISPPIRTASIGLGESLLNAKSVVCPDPMDLLLVPAWTLPIPSVDITESLIEQCLLLGPFFDPKTHHRSLDATTIVGITTSESVSGAGTTDNSLYSWGTAEYDLLLVLLNSVSIKDPLSCKFFHPIFSESSLLSSNLRLSNQHPSAKQSFNQIVIGALGSSEGYDDVIRGAEGMLESMFHVYSSAMKPHQKVSVIPLRDGLLKATSQLLAGMIDGDPQGNVSLSPRLLLWLLLRIIGDFYAPTSRPRVESAEASLPELCSTLCGVLARMQGFHITKTVSSTSAASPAPWLPSQNGTASSALTLEYPIARSFPGAKVLNWRISFGAEGSAPSSSLRSRLRPYEWSGSSALKLSPGLILPVQLPRLAIIESLLYLHPCNIDFQNSIDEKRKASIISAAGLSAAPPNSILACHALVISALNQATSSIIDVSISGFYEKENMTECIYTSSSSFSLSSASLRVSLRVAQSSRCLSALHLQRSIQLLQVVTRCARCMISLPSTIASMRTLITALLSFIAMHLGAVFELCINGTPLPNVPLDGTGTVVRATAIASAIAAALEVLLSSGRLESSSVVGKGCRVGEALFGDNESTSCFLFPGSCEPASLITHTAALSVAHIQSTFVRVLAEQSGMNNASLAPELPNVLVMSQLFQTTLINASTVLNDFGDKNQDDYNSEKKLKVSSPQIDIEKPQIAGELVTKDEIRKDGKKSTREKRNEGFSDEDEEPLKKRSTQESSFPSSLGAFSSIAHDADDLEVEGGPSSSGVSLGTSASAVGKKALGGLTRDALFSTLVDAIAMTHPIVRSLISETSSLVSKNTSLCLDNQILFTFKIHLSEALPYATRTDLSIPSLEEFLRRYAQFSTRALVPSAFIAAIASVAITPSGNSRRIACTRAISAILVRLATCETSSGTISNASLEGGPEKRAWDCIAGRLALHSVFLVIAMTDDIKTVLKEEPIPAREPTLSVRLYTNLSHVPHEEEARRLRMLFSPFGSEIHDIDQMGNAIVIDDPSISVSSLLFALLVHLNPFSGYAEPGVLLADVVTGTGILTKDCPESAFDVALGSVSAYYDQVLHDLHSIEKGRSRSDMLDDATAYRIHRKVFPCTPVDSFRDWAFHIIMRVALNASLFPQARAAAVRVLAPFALLFGDMNLFNRSYATSTCSPILESIAKEPPTLSFPGLGLPPIHLNEIDICNGQGLLGWNDIESNENESHGLFIHPLKMTLLSSDTTAFTDGSCADRMISSLWSLSYLISRCAPESNAALLQLIFRCHPKHPFSTLAKRALAHAASVSGFCSLNNSSNLQVADGRAGTARLLHSRIDFLLTQWILRCLPWSSFPYKPLGYSSLKDFLGTHRLRITAMCLINAALRRIGWCLHHLREELVNTPMSNSSDVNELPMSDIARNAIKRLEAISSYCSQQIPEAWPALPQDGLLSKLEYEMFDNKTGENESGVTISRLADNAYNYASNRLSSTGWKWTTLGSAKGSVAAGTAGGDVMSGVGGSCFELVQFSKALTNGNLPETNDLYATSVDQELSILTKSQVTLCADLLSEAIPCLLAWISPVPNFTDAASERDADYSKSKDDLKEKDVRSIAQLTCAAVLLTAAEILAKGRSTDDVNSDIPQSPELCLSSITMCCSRSVAATSLGSLVVNLQAPVFNLEGTLLQQISSREFSKIAVKSSFSFLAYFFDKALGITRGSPTADISSISTFFATARPQAVLMILRFGAADILRRVSQISLIHMSDERSDQLKRIDRNAQQWALVLRRLVPLFVSAAIPVAILSGKSGASLSASSKFHFSSGGGITSLFRFYSCLITSSANALRSASAVFPDQNESYIRLFSRFITSVRGLKMALFKALSDRIFDLITTSNASVGSIFIASCRSMRLLVACELQLIFSSGLENDVEFLEARISDLTLTIETLASWVYGISLAEEKKADTSDFFVPLVRNTIGTCLNLCISDFIAYTHAIETVSTIKDYSELSPHLLRDSSFELLQLTRGTKFNAVTQTNVTTIVNQCRDIMTKKVINDALRLIGYEMNFKQIMTSGTSEAMEVVCASLQGLPFRLAFSTDDSFAHPALLPAMSSLMRLSHELVLSFYPQEKPLLIPYPHKIPNSNATNREAPMGLCLHLLESIACTNESSPLKNLAILCVNGIETVQGHIIREISSIRRSLAELLGEFTHVHAHTHGPLLDLSPEVLIKKSNSNTLSEVSVNYAMYAHGSSRSDHIEALGSNAGSYDSSQPLCRVLCTPACLLSSSAAFTLLSTAADTSRSEKIALETADPLNPELEELVRTRGETKAKVSKYLSHHGLGCVPDIPLYSAESYCHVRSLGLLAEAIALHECTLGEIGLIKDENFSARTPLFPLSYANDFAAIVSLEASFPIPLLFFTLTSTAQNIIRSESGSEAFEMLPSRYRETLAPWTPDAAMAIQSKCMRNLNQDLSENSDVRNTYLYNDRSLSIESNGLPSHIKSLSISSRNESPCFAYLDSLSPWLWPSSGIEDIPLQLPSLMVTLCCISLAPFRFLVTGILGFGSSPLSSCVGRVFTEKLFPLIIANALLEASDKRFGVSQCVSEAISEDEHRALEDGVYLKGDVGFGGETGAVSYFWDFIMSGRINEQQLSPETSDKIPNAPGQMMGSAVNRHPINTTGAAQQSKSARLTSGPVFAAASLAPITLSSEEPSTSPLNRSATAMGDIGVSGTYVKTDVIVPGLRSALTERIQCAALLSPISLESTISVLSFLRNIRWACLRIQIDIKDLQRFQKSPWPGHARTFSETVSDGKPFDEIQQSLRGQISLQEYKVLSSGDVFYRKVETSTVFATTSLPDETYSLRQIVHGLILRFPSFEGETSETTRRRRTIPLSALNGPRVSLQLGLDIDYSKIVYATEKRWNLMSKDSFLRTKAASLGSHALFLSECALTALHGVPSLHVIPPAWFGLVSMSDTFTSLASVQSRFDTYDLLLTVAASPSPMALVDPDGPVGIVGLSGLRMCSPTSQSQNKGVRLDVIERLAVHNGDWATILGLHTWGDFDESYTPTTPVQSDTLRSNLHSLILDISLGSSPKKVGLTDVIYPLKTFQALSLISSGFTTPVVASPLTTSSDHINALLLTSVSSAVGNLSDEMEFLEREPGLVTHKSKRDKLLSYQSLDDLVRLSNDFAVACVTAEQYLPLTERFEVKTSITPTEVLSLSIATSTRLNRIRHMRLYGRIPQAVTDLAGLQELRKVILGETHLEFISKPHSPTVGSKRPLSSSTRKTTERDLIDDCFSKSSCLADDGLLSSEQAQLAWAVGDAQTALALLRRASIQLVSALRLILAFAAEEVTTTSQWVQISLFCCSGRLSSFLIATAKWLTESGLDHEDIDRIRNFNEAFKLGAGKNAIEKLGIFLDALSSHVINGGSESSFVFLQAALDLTTIASDISKLNTETEVPKSTFQINFQRHGSSIQSRAHLVLARYCDNAHTALLLQSSRNEGIASKKNKLEELISKTTKYSALIKAQRINEAADVLGGVDFNAMRRYIAEIKQGLDEDIKLQETSSIAMKSYQKACVKHYCRYLRLRSTIHDLLLNNESDELKTVFRLVSMWTTLDTEKFGISEHVDSLLSLFGNEFADKAPPSSLLLALPQLVAHLGTNPGQKDSTQSSNSFASALEHAVFRMLVAAPHRTSLQLLALEKGERVIQVTRVGEGTRRKIQAAMRILSKGSSTSSRLRRVIASMRLLSDVYVSIAMRPIHKMNDADRGKETKLSSVLISRSIGQVPQPPTTTEPQVTISTINAPTFASLDPYDKAFEGHPVSVLEHVSSRSKPKQGSMKEGTPRATIKSSLKSSSLAVNFDDSDYWPSPMSDMPVITSGHIFSPLSINLLLPSTIDSPDHYTLPEHVTSFGTVYSHPLSGISFPKKLKIVSSNGRSYSQLIKGGWHEPKSSVDDMRQDAIIEGLFHVLNSLLLQDSRANSRKLRMSTYRVIPLSPTSGVLEWIDNIIPIGHWIDEDPWNSHRRYRPKEWDRKICRDTINESHARWKQQNLPQAITSTSGGTAKSSLRSASLIDPRPEALKSVFRHRSPVFQNFFSEMFPSPEALIAARLAYTRSTAVASVVGYIAGISDRHYNNIMVHCSPGENGASGEVLHIDFGIVFEQGLLLPTPETVPFRLTRDIVAGFGVANTRGAFSSSMETCLDVLRNNADTIMGVFSVLLHDPLCKWVLTDDKARKVLRTRSAGGVDEERHEETGEVVSGNISFHERATIDGSGDKHDVAAMHVMKRIDSKLRGTDFVNVSATSSSSVLPIKAQVVRLIDMAQDIDSLSKLFSGWHAWC